MKFRLKLVSPISSNCMNTERKFINNIIYEINRIMLIMMFIYFLNSNPCCIIYSSILKSSHLIITRIFKG